MAEPAIQVLNMEVEKVTGGYIHNKVMLSPLHRGGGGGSPVHAQDTAGHIPVVLYCPRLSDYIYPGPQVKPLFVGLAFDSGGVVTGPMIATFILAFTVGSSEAVPGSNPLFDGFGMIALVAMVPILSLLILGALYARSEAKGKEGERDAVRQRA